VGKRRHSRELVLKFLYEYELNPGDFEERLAFFGKRDSVSLEVWEFASGMIKTTIERQREIDEQLDKVCQNWTLFRMAVVDRNILRMAACELIYFTTPATVVIDEAIEIAKKYGGDNSSDFINGILDRVRTESVEIVP
tara:strand:+ start:3014 stop:3427 length:414 start_codon:yes stop_codon:yes gene_type:complete